MERRDMPAVSEKQRMLMAIAEHHPEKLYARHRDVAKMSKGQLHDYASTKGLKHKVARAMRRRKKK
jgi:hypothetical protein